MTLFVLDVLFVVPELALTERLEGVERLFSITTARSRPVAVVADF